MAALHKVKNHLKHFSYEFTYEIIKIITVLLCVAGITGNYSNLSFSYVLSLETLLGSLFYITKIFVVTKK